MGTDGHRWACVYWKFNKIVWLWKTRGAWWSALAGSWRSRRADGVSWRCRTWPLSVDRSSLLGRRFGHPPDQPRQTHGWPQSIELNSSREIDSSIQNNEIVAESYFYFRKIVSFIFISILEIITRAPSAAVCRFSALCRPLHAALWTRPYAASGIIIIIIIWFKRQAF